MQVSAGIAGFAKSCMPMVAFGSHRQFLIYICGFVPSLALFGIHCAVEQSRFVVMLWGNDLLLVKGLKHMAGQLLRMLLCRNLDESAFDLSSWAMSFVCR